MKTRYYNVQEMADIFGVKELAIYRWISANKLNATRQYNIEGDDLNGHSCFLYGTQKDIVKAMLERPYVKGYLRWMSVRHLIDTERISFRTLRKITKMEKRACYDLGVKHGVPVFEPEEQTAIYSKCVNVADLDHFFNTYRNTERFKSFLKTWGIDLDVYFKEGKADVAHSQVLPVH